MTDGEALERTVSILQDRIKALTQQRSKIVTAASGKPGKREALAQALLFAADTMLTVEIARTHEVIGSLQRMTVPSGDQDMTAFATTPHNP